MIRRTTVARAVAGVFALGNAGGALVALSMREPVHALVHAVLVVVGGYVLFRLTRRVADGGVPQLAGAGSEEDRLNRIEQTVDAIAVEVERIGEAQRFLVKLQASRSPGGANRGE